MVTYKQIKTCNQRDRHGANPQGYGQPLTTKIRVSEYSQEAENDGNGAILPVVKDMKTTQSWLRVHESSLNSQKVQNARGHLINTPSILPATRVQHAVISMSTT